MSLITTFARYDANNYQDLNHRANQNKAAYRAKLKEWMEFHTVQEIADANNARKLLRRRLDRGSVFRLLQDDRAPSRPKGAYLRFSADRFASGDLKGLSIPEAGKLVSEEWKDLSAAEKEV